MPRPISVIITDLDNTLFDWADVWYKSFKAMLDRLVMDSGIAEEALLSDFKLVHEKHNTSEYAFSIEELPSLQAKYPGEDLSKKFDDAIQAYRNARRSALCLYASVSDTLETLKDKGCLLVGYTESMSFYSSYRVRSLGLDRTLDYLFSPPDHELPGRLTQKEIRYYPEERYKLRRTVHRHLPKGVIKPDPKVLLDIIRDVGAAPSEAIYVGDSLMKDVAMAQAAGVKDVWAKYGEAKDRREYELLRKVTHWTAKDVEREKRLTPSELEPSCVLEKSLGEILGQFPFCKFVDKSEARMALAGDLWKKTVEVQEHFNDLELRIRNYAVTVLAAIIGLAAYAVKENLQIALLGHRTSIAAITLAGGIIPWLAFYFMDRFWYHRLLYGAVAHGKLIEDRWKECIPELSLTESIGRHSPLRLFGWEIHSPRKIDLFYGAGFLLLLALSLLVQFAARPA